jgi:hypothetical protein
LWQWKNSFTLPSGRTLKCSTLWLLTVEPSDPIPCRLNVNMPFTVLPLWLKLPQTVNLPVKLGRLGSTSGTAVNLPVCVNVAWTLPLSNTVSCSTRLLVVVIV